MKTHMAGLQGYSPPPINEKLIGQKYANLYAAGLGTRPKIVFTTVESPSQRLFWGLEALALGLRVR